MKTLLLFFLLALKASAFSLGGFGQTAIPFAPNLIGTNQVAAFTWGGGGSTAGTTIGWNNDGPTINGVADGHAFYADFGTNLTVFTLEWRQYITSCAATNAGEHVGMGSFFTNGSTWQLTLQQPNTADLSTYIGYRFNGDTEIKTNIAVSSTLNFGVPTHFKSVAQSGSNTVVNSQWIANSDWATDGTQLLNNQYFVPTNAITSGNFGLHSSGALGTFLTVLLKDGNANTILQGPPFFINYGLFTVQGNMFTNGWCYWHSDTTLFAANSYMPDISGVQMIDGTVSVDCNPISGRIWGLSFNGGGTATDCVVIDNNIPSLTHFVLTSPGAATRVSMESTALASQSYGTIKTITCRRAGTSCSFTYAGTTLQCTLTNSGIVRVGTAGYQSNVGYGNFFVSK